MARFIRDPHYLGLIVPDERVSFANLVTNDGSASGSSYTQANRRNGRPTYDRAEVAASSSTAGDRGPALVLETTGTQAAVDYHVKVLRGGHAGGPCEVVQRPSLTSSESWRGFQSLNVVEWHNTTDEVPHFLPASGAVTYASCTTHDHHALFAASNSSSVVTAWRYNPATHLVVGSAVVFDGQSGTTMDEDQAVPTLHDDRLVELLTLPSGRILAFVLTQEIGDSAVLAQVWSAYSDDHGATWRTASAQALDVPVDVSVDQPIKMRAAYARGQVLLIIEKTWVDGVTKYGALQYGSDDGGLSFNLVEDSADSGVEGLCWDVVTDIGTGAFVVVRSTGAGAADTIEVRRLASPFVPLSLCPANASVSTDHPGHLSAFADTDGVLWVVWGVVASSAETRMARSDDGGVRWTQCETPVFDTGDTSQPYDHWDVTAVQGRAVWLVGESASTLDDFLIIVETGGWTTLTQPRVSGSEPTELTSFGGSDAATWLPFAVPEDYGWTRTGAAGGRALETGAPFGVHVTTAGAQCMFSRTISVSQSAGIILFFELQMLAAGSVASNHCGVRYTGGTGALYIDVEARFDGSAVRVYDNVAAAAVATVSIDVIDQPWAFKFCVQGKSCTLYGRAVDSDEWTMLVSTITLSDTAGATTSAVYWGHCAVGTTESRWSNVHYVAYAGTETGIWNDTLAMNTLTSAPWSLHGRRLPASPYRAWLDQGLWIRGSGGPGTRGDTWSISPSYRQGVEHLDLALSPSPSRPWRSTNTNLNRIAWALSGSITSGFGSTSSGIGLVGCNFPTARWRAWDGAAWNTLVELDFTLGPLRWTRTGDVVTVSTSGTTQNRFIAYDELAGCTFNLDGTLRRILHNTEGLWDNTVTTKRPHIILEGITGAEPASGTAGAIWLRDAVGLVHEKSTLYTKYALEIPSNSTVDGYFEVGALVAGGLVVFATKHSENRTITTEATTELSDSRAGISTARVVGRSFRTVTAGWVEGFDSSPLFDGVPDYVSMRAAGEPIAARSDHVLLEGVYRRLGGPAKPCIYLPRIDPTDVGSDYSRIAGRESIVYGRLIATPSRETVKGDELRSEVVRLTGFSIREER